MSPSHVYSVAVGVATALFYPIAGPFSCSDIYSQEELTVVQTQRRWGRLALFTLPDVCLEGSNQQMRALQDANTEGR